MSHIIVNPSSRTIDRLRTEVACWKQDKMQKAAFDALHHYQYPVDLRNFGRKTKSGFIFSTLRLNDIAKYPTAMISYKIDRHMISQRKASAAYVSVLSAAYTNSDDLIYCIATLKDTCKDYNIFFRTYGDEDLRDIFLKSGFEPFVNLEGETPYAKTVNIQFAYPVCQTVWYKSQPV